MKYRTPEYIASMEQQFRERSTAEVAFANADPTAATDGTWALPAQTPWSTGATWLDGDYAFGEAYFTCELNSGLLDGTQRILPDDAPYNVDGFIAEPLSDASGTYNGVVLTKTFTLPHELLGLTLQFDTRREECPVSMQADFLDAGGAVVSTRTQSYVASTEWILMMPNSAVSALRLTFLTGLPYRRARLERLLFGINYIFDNSVLKGELVRIDDVDPLARRLPTETLTYTIIDNDKEYNPDNLQGLFGFLEVGAIASQRFGYDTLGDGAIEHLAPDAYALASLPTTQSNSATFAFTRRLALLTEPYGAGTWKPTTAKAYAEKLLTAANLPPIAGYALPYVVDDSLSGLTVLDINAAKINDGLQILARATACELRTLPDGRISLVPYVAPTTKELAIPNREIMQDANASSRSPRVRDVVVNVYSWAVETDVSELAKVTQSGNTATIYWDSPAHNVTFGVTIGTVTAQEVYATMAVLSFGSAAEKTVTVLGNTLSSATTQYIRAVNPQGADETIDIPLITTTAIAQRCAEHTATWLNQQLTYTLDHRGEPALEVNDGVTIQTPFSPSLNGIVLRSETRLSQGLHGKAIVKVVQ